jgi:hypothetical protein
MRDVIMPLCTPTVFSKNEGRKRVKNPKTASEKLTLLQVI